ncbi:Transmembrane anterior posterior transformation protein 1 [Coelomomyces lativittatus]|nr:Transmembrane anterior posterior transformation protein 1 [Coelomomyces lativittatus]
MKNENELPKRKQRLPLLLSTSLCDHTTGLQPTALTTSKSRWRALSDSLLETQSTKNRLDGLSSSEDLLKSPQLPPCPPSTSISSTLDPPLHSSSNETYTNVHKPPSLTFTEYIIEIFKPSQPFIHGAGQRSASVFNFFHVPLELEKTLWLGYFVCLDAFLDVLVILPLRLAYSIFVFFTQNRKFNIITDLWKELLFILAFWGLLQFDPSILYHDIRGQSLLKLYVVFNLLEVCDKLCSSFGLDVLDSLFSRPTTTLHHFTFSLHFSLALLYIGTNK